MRIKVLFLIFFLTIGLSWDSITAFGLDFKDIPNNWSGPALEKAVSNGLLNGNNGKIRPQDNLTRAEMATIINIAFNSSEKSSLTKFSDVSQGKWYYEEMAKAVQMQTFIGNGDKLNPQQNITREEAFVVLANAFKIAENERTSLNIFFDKNDISKWAIDATSALVSEGYVAGSNGNVNPKSNITRAEFAQIMDNLVKVYITKAGEYKEDIKGNVMVNVPGVILKGMTITGDLIIGDGVGKGEVIIEDTKVTGRVLVRGGGENSIKILGNSNIENIIVAKINGKVRIYTENSLEIGEVIIDGKDDVILQGDFNSVLLVASDVTLFQNNAKIELIVVTGSRVKIVVDSKSDIDKVLVNSNDVKIEGKGKIREVIANGNNILVTVIGTEVTVGPNSKGVFAGEKEVLQSKTQIVTEVAPSPSEKTSSRGGSSEEGGSPGGSRNKETPEVPVPQVPVPELPVPEVTVPEVPVPEVPIPELPVPQVPVPQVPVPQIPVPEVPIPEVPVPQVPVPQVPPTLSSISITTPATKLIYNVGDTLDISGMVVTGIYSDATTKVEAVTPTHITGFDNSQAELCQTLTITIGEVTTSYEVEIKAEINAISDINNAMDAAEISQAITMHSGEIGLNLADYNALEEESKVEVQKTLLEPVFTNITQIETAFNKAVLGQKALVEIYKASDANIKMIVISNSEALGFAATTVADYKLLTFPNMSKVHEALRAKKVLNITQVNRAFETAVSVLIINQINKTSPVTEGNLKMESALTRYKTILGLDEIAYDTYIAVNTYTLSFKTKVNNDLMSAVMNSAADVKSTFTAAVTAEAVRIIDAQALNYIDRDLRTYASILGLNLSEYDALANTVFIQTKMVEERFITAAHLKEFFDELVAQEKALEALPILVAFNTAQDSAKMDNLITTYSILFNAEDYAYYCNKIGELAKHDVRTFMLTPEFQTNEDIQREFAIALMNKATPSFYEQILVRNVIILGLSSSSNEFGLLGSQESQSILNAINVARPLLDKTRIVVIAFNTTGNESYMGNLIHNNSDLLRLDMQDYNLLKDKSTVHNAMIIASLTNIEEVKTAFETAVLAQR